MNTYTKLECVNTNFAPEINIILTTGHSTPGVGSAKYVRSINPPVSVLINPPVPSPPSENSTSAVTLNDTKNNVNNIILPSWCFQSQDGTYWILNEPEPDPVMFGAILDGVTDTFNAITECINYIVSIGGGKIRLPRGNYAISQTIIVPNSVNIEIAGTGFNTVLNLMNGGTTNYPFIFWCGTADIYPTILNIHDIHIGNSYINNCDGIYMINCNGSKVKNCFFIGGTIRHAITLNRCYNVQVEDNYGNSIAGSMIYTMSECYHLNIKNNISLTCGSDTYYTYDLRGGLTIDISMTNNDTEGGSGLFIVGDCKSLLVESNYTEHLTPNMAHGYVINNLTGAIFRGNWFGKSTLMTVINMHQSEFSANTLYDCNINFGTSTDLSGFGNNLLGGAVLGSLRSTPLQLYPPWAVKDRPLSYKKNLNGDVLLFGSFSGGVNGAIIGVLPVGYRPANLRTFPVATNLSTSFSSVSIDGNGVITAVLTSNGYTSVDGITFQAEN